MDPAEWRPGSPRRRGTGEPRRPPALAPRKWGSEALRPPSPPPPARQTPRPRAARARRAAPPPRGTASAPASGSTETTSSARSGGETAAATALPARPGRSDRATELFKETSSPAHPHSPPRPQSCRKHPLVREAAQAAKRARDQGAPLPLSTPASPCRSGLTVSLLSRASPLAALLSGAPRRTRRRSPQARATRASGPAWRSRGGKARAASPHATRSADDDTPPPLIPAPHEASPRPPLLPPGDDAGDDPLPKRQRSEDPAPAAAPGLTVTDDDAANYLALARVPPPNASSRHLCSVPCAPRLGG